MALFGIVWSSALVDLPLMRYFSVDFSGNLPSADPFYSQEYSKYKRKVPRIFLSPRQHLPQPLADLGSSSRAEL